MSIRYFELTSRNFEKADEFQSPLGGQLKAGPSLRAVIPMGWKLDPDFLLFGFGIHRGEVVIDDRPGHFRRARAEYLSMNPQDTDTYTAGPVRRYGKGGYPVIFELILAIVNRTRFGTQIKVFESLFAP